MQAVGDSRSAPAARAKSKGLLPFKLTAVIIVFAEWANLEGKGQTYDPSFFDRIKAAAKGVPGKKDEYIDEGMPFLTGKWVFPIKREFNKPYNKRCYVTNSTKLHESGWVEETTQRIDDHVGRWINGCRISAQIQHYGGSQSRYRTNDPDDKTSYSWRRDSTVVAGMDGFYLTLNLIGKTPKEQTDEWVTKNDELFRGPGSKFAPGLDRRLFWASYYTTLAERDLEVSWPFYHEDDKKWQKLKAIKKRVDPDNIFSPNDFSVKAQ